MTSLRKKIWKAFRRTLLVGLGLLLVTVLTLAVVGVPNFGQVVTKNVPRVGWTSLIQMLGVASPPPLLSLQGFDAAGSLRFDDGAGTVSKLDTGTGEVAPFMASLPFDSSAQWIPGTDDHLLLIDRSTDEQYDLAIHHASTGGTDTLLSEGYGVFQYQVSPDGSFALAYVLDLATQEHTLYRVRLNGDHAPEALCSFAGHLTIQAIASSLRHAYALQTDDDKAARLLRIDLADGSHEIVFAEEREGRFYHGNDPAWLFLQPRFLLGKDDNVAFYARTGGSEDDREFVCLWERNLATGESRRLSPPRNGDVCRFCVSHDERYVVYVLVEKGHPSLHVFDRHEGKDQVVYDDREDVIAHQWSLEILTEPGRDRAWFSTASVSQRGPCLMSVDLATGAVSTVVDRRSPATDEPPFVITEFEYATSAPVIGAMTGIHTYRIEPSDSGNERHGVVIAFHGGPDTSFSPVFASMNPLLGRFLAQDYTVLIPNYRGSWGYGTTFEQADDGRLRESQIDDVGALLAWIEQQPDLDSERIVLFGESWGGYLVTRSMVRYPDAFAGGMSIVGVSSLRSIAENRFFCGWEREVGDLSEPGMAEFLDAISPCNHSEGITTPLYLFAGGKDPRVPPEPGRQWAASLEQAGGDVWYVEIPYAGHSISGAAPQDFLYAAASMSEFIDRLGK